MPFQLIRNEHGKFMGFSWVRPSFRIMGAREVGSDPPLHYCDSCGARAEMFCTTHSLFLCGIDMQIHQDSLRLLARVDDAFINLLPSTGCKCLSLAALPAEIRERRRA